MASFTTCRTKVDRCKTIVKETNDRLSDQVRDTRSWWVGLAGDTFREQWREIDSLGNDMKRSVSAINRDIRNLERSVEKADREREREKERKHLAAQRAITGGGPQEY